MHLVLTFFTEKCIPNIYFIVTHCFKQDIKHFNKSSDNNNIYYTVVIAQWHKNLYSALAADWCSDVNAREGNASKESCLKG